MLKIKKFHDRVRHLINASKELLPDETIDFYEYRGMAEDKIKDIVKDWRSLPENSEKYKKFESAIVYQTALLLYPSIRNQSIKVKQITGGKVEYFEPEKLQNQIQDMLDKLLSDLSKEYSTSISYFRLSNI
ncbi:MAG: hypothetical protein K2L48_01380 [Mycoplasmoidaceae bacterium]|nr:hypothetical protein [Mycoplasmoidaceae bacterium]